MRTETTSSSSSSTMPLEEAVASSLSWPPLPLLLFGGLQIPATAVIVLSGCSMSVIPSPNPELSAVKNFPDTAPGCGRMLGVVRSVGLLIMYVALVEFRNAGGGFGPKIFHANSLHVGVLLHNASAASALDALPMKADLLPVRQQL